MLLDEYFLELRNLFFDVLGKLLLGILKKCLFLKDILNIGIEKVIEILKIVIKNRVGIKKVVLIYEVVENLIGVFVGLEGVRYRLNFIIRNLEKI